MSHNIKKMSYLFALLELIYILICGELRDVKFVLQSFTYESISLWKVLQTLQKGFRMSHQEWDM
jgi:hypothetical protein